MRIPEQRHRYSQLCGLRPAMLPVLLSPRCKARHRSFVEVELATFLLLRPVVNSHALVRARRHEDLPTNENGLDNTDVGRISELLGERPLFSIIVFPNYHSLKENQNVTKII